MASAFEILQILSTRHITLNKTKWQTPAVLPIPLSMEHLTQTPRPNRYNTLNSTPAAPFAQRECHPVKQDRQTDRSRRSCQVRLREILFFANSDEDKGKNNKTSKQAEKCGLFEINVQRNGSSATREKKALFPNQCRIKRCRASRRCLCAIQRNWAGRRLACLHAWPSLRSLLSRLGSRRRKRGN